MAITISTSKVSKTKSLGLAGVVGALVTSFTNTATSGDHFSQILMGAGGVVLYVVDHLKTVVGAAKSATKEG